MKLCFVSENGAKETYFVDAPSIKLGLTSLSGLKIFSYDPPPPRGVIIAQMSENLKTLVTLECRSKQSHVT
jgi:hypothetical protein